MTVQSSAGSIGARVQATRKARGIRTTRELAELITGATVTESVIENIESGRKVNLEVGQLLSIAMALRVPPTYLLAPIGDPNAPLDLPNLSDVFDGMTASQFDAWLSNRPYGNYKASTNDEMNARSELAALREFVDLTSEIERLREAIDVPPVFKQEDEDSWRRLEARLRTAENEIKRVHVYLIAAGWDLQLYIQDKWVGSAGGASTQ
jgi:transcriptional regulator with XRE-family HTH domain